MKWVKGEGDVIVAIEGSNGLSRPLEKALREAGSSSTPSSPADTDKFRKAVLGQNKDNEKDAESVARYAMAMEPRASWRGIGGCGLPMWSCSFLPVAMKGSLRR